MFFYLDVKNGILEPEFQNEIYSYYIGVDEEVKSVDFDFQVDSKTKINILGNDDLKIGDNYIFIELDKDNKLKTYTFLVNKEQTATVFNYDEPVKLEVEPIKKENYEIVPGIVILCLSLILLLFKIIFLSKKKQLNR